MIASQWHEIHYFKPGEFQYPAEMSFALLQKLDLMRSYYGKPIVITDDYRPTPSVGVKDSAHLRGLAVDLRVSNSRARYGMVRAAMLAGFDRIGVYDKHVHVDIDDTLPAEVLWLGESV